LVLEHVSDMTTVDDPALLEAMFYLWERLKLVVEPTGALGAAAALAGAASIRGARVGVVLSGGDVGLSPGSQWGARRPAAGPRGEAPAREPRRADAPRPGASSAAPRQRRRR